jgi:primosomal protein N' (replication factor Y)
MAMKTYISVILPLKLEWEPCYALKEEETAQVGDRVKVLFAGKAYTGAVSAVGIEPQTELSKIKDIVSVESGLERIREEEIELWRRVAEYYMCSVGEVYKAAYPQRKIDLEAAKAAALQKAQERHERMLNAMREKVAKLKAKLEEKESALASAKPGTKKREQLEAMVGRLTNEMSIAEAALAHAEADGHSGQTGDKFARTDSQSPDPSQPEPDITLTQAQEEAYAKAAESLKAGKPVMLHGVTGSGKTEIYIRLAADALRKGKNVLYLVPEIALSKQLTDRVGEHFGERLLTYNSGESETNRRTIAEIIRNAGKISNSGSGKPDSRTSHTAGTQDTANYIVLGTRSSLFLPHNNLGLIIVDEEHDSSYKQESPAPRYNGRDTALMLSVIHKCGIILGSATPSLEETYNCECGRHTLVTLNEKFHGDSETEIEIIDTKAERKKRGMEGSFSRKLIEHIRRTLADGGQVMILRSRRAWASAMQCEECGDIQKCPHCNVSMSYHKNGDKGTMKCHYCGHTETFTGTCTKCGKTLKPLGSGTQKIEEEAAILFPEATIARLDSDTAQNRNYETKVIKEFAEGKIDILIGTQILTKGFDFSNLRLTAVIAADTMLGIQDFRADEKALQLLEQFKGRCGRRGSKGMFIIQTSQPEHPIYQRIAEGETKTFNDDLLAERKMFGFPPYSRIVEITIRDNSQKRADLMASRLAATLRTVYKTPSGQGLLAASPVTGPYSPVVDKVQEEHIRCIRVSMRKDRTLAAKKAVLNETIAKFEKEQKYSGYITLNVDPA